MNGSVRSDIASGNERKTYPIVYFEDLALDIPVPEAARIFGARSQLCSAEQGP
jgi:hypothetical protein